MINTKSLENKIEKLGDLIAQNETLIDVQAREIYNDNCPDSAESIRHHLEELSNKERKLKVGIIGRVKAGKSSLINSLIFDGKDILPKAATPMTAALTTISYSETFSAKVEFFSGDDFIKIRQSAERYQEDYNKLLAEKKAAFESKKKSSDLGRKKQSKPGKFSDDERLERMVQSELDAASPKLKAAFDLFRRMDASSISANGLPEYEELTEGSAEQLAERLNDYVGSSGKYMPFTKILHIGIPLESLKDLEVVDTPGINDAVASREQRTYDMLKECNVVFLVSPAGQFLSSQDLDLADRLTKREGVQEVYVVASQSDLQLHAEQRQKHGDDIAAAINDLKSILSKQATNTLKVQSNPVLSAIAEQQTERLFVSSGICQTLLSQPKDKWDEGASHAFSLLSNSYPNAFTPSSTSHSLELLTGQKLLLSAIQEVRGKKEAIVTSQSISFVEARTASVNKATVALMAYVDSKVIKLSETDIASLEEDLKQLEGKKDKGELAANNLFIDEVDGLIESISAELDQFIKGVNQSLKNEVGEAEGSTTEHYQKKKKGVLAWGARLFGGGYEDKSRELTTVKSSPVRRGLESMKDELADKISTVVDASTRRWRTSLESKLSSKLRDVIGDDAIDIDQMQAVCRQAIGQVGTIEELVLPSLPGELSSSGKLKGYEAEKFIEDAKDYAHKLVKNSRKYSKKVTEHSGRKLKGFNIGEYIVSSLVEESEAMAELVKNKKLTIDKLESLKQSLSEVSHG